MIAAPPGWTLLPRIDGLTVVPPEGPSVGVIRYTERVRPLAPAAKIIEERLRLHSAFSPDAEPVMERTTTREGEYAAVVSCVGSLKARPAQWCLGLVFGDDFYARVEGFSAAPESFATFAATVRDLTINDHHFLGVRRRRYMYDSNGWRSIARGFVTDWICVGFPRSWGMITVYPALPTPAAGPALGALLHRSATSRLQGELGPARPITTRSSMGGELLTMRALDGGALFSIAAVADGRFMYSAELLSKTPPAFAEHQAAFERLWMSIEPIPHAGPHANLTPMWVPPID